MREAPLVKSPQDRALDTLLWERLSAFWSEVYDPSDKDALNAMYDAFLKALDADYVRLYQIDSGKSLYTCPIFTQRRWARIDFNKYGTLKNWFRFLTAGDINITAGLDDSTINVPDDGSGILGGSNEAGCGRTLTNHTKHWHIAFPWKMVNDPSRTLTERQTLNLSYPIYQPLTALWVIDPQGKGLRLSPGVDYVVGASGKSIQIFGATPSKRYEIETAFDFSQSVFDGYAPAMVAPSGIVAPNIILLPSGFGNRFPVHVMILRDPPAVSVSSPDGTVSSTATNTLIYDTERHFVPASQVTYVGNDRVQLPPDVVITTDDVVLLFGVKQSESLPAHQHLKISRTIGTSQPLNQVDLYDYAAGTPIFGSVGFLANEFRVTANGFLLSPNDYRFDSNVGTLFFRTGVQPTASGQVQLEVEYTDESMASGDVLDTSGHLHYLCFASVSSVPTSFETFDDGGIYDDPADPYGRFDSTTSTNVVVLDVNADVTTLNVYLSGRLLRPGQDFVASSVASGASSQLRLHFATSIVGRSIMVTYRSASLAYQFGGDDLFRSSGQTLAGFAGVGGTNRYGITQAVLDKLAANFVQVVTAFKSRYGVSDTDMSRLIEAAYIAAAGGNPILTLFFDEFPEYDTLPINSANQTLTAAQTRAIESVGTDFVGIPFLQDHVISPSIRLHEGTDYLVSRGQIQGSSSLLAKRGPDDATPGQWWVPLLVLDESFLQKNFGFLLGDLRESSNTYRDTLAANMRLRFQGPTVNNLHRVVCAYLGSDLFDNDGTVTGYRTEIAKYGVTLSSANGGTQQTYSFGANDARPSFGDSFYPGQSLRGPRIADFYIRGLLEYTGASVSLQDDVHLLRAGDVIRMEMQSADGKEVALVTRVVQEVLIETNTFIPRYVVKFTKASNYVPFTGALFRASRDKGAPYATIAGSITAVTPSYRKFLVMSDGVEFEVSPDVPENYARGQRVYRGDPLEPDKAIVYDGHTRPDWYKYNATHVRKLLEGKVSFFKNKQLPAYATVIFQLDDQVPAYSAFSLAVMDQSRQVLHGRVTIDGNVYILQSTLGVESDYHRAFYPSLAVAVGDQAHQTLGASFVIPGGTEAGTYNVTTKTSSIGDYLKTSNATTLSVNDQYINIVLSPVTPDLPRGTVLTVKSDADAKEYAFQIAGPSSLYGGYLVTSSGAAPRTKQRMTGTVTVTLPGADKTDVLEVSYAAGGAAPVVQAAARGVVKGTYLSTTPTTSFPAAGRCQVTLLDGPGGGPGSTFEFSYTAKGPSSLEGLQWTSIEDTCLGSYSSVVDIGCNITLISALQQDMVNPAFVALVNNRARYANTRSNIPVTAANAPVLYSLLQSTATIVETAAVTHPAPMMEALREATPVGTSTIIFSKHVLVDQWNLVLGGSQAIYSQPTLEITVAAPSGATVVPGSVLEVTLPVGSMTVGLAADLVLGTTLPLSGPFTYSWQVIDTAGRPRTPVVGNTTDTTLSVDFRDVRSELYVTLTVVDGQRGHSYKARAKVACAAA